MVYVGFWRRLGAHIVDATAVFVGSTVLALALIYGLSAISGESSAQEAVPHVSASPMIISEQDQDYALGAFSMVMQAILVVTGTIYHTVFVASRWQATLGKRLACIVVVTKTGERLGYGRAFLRHVCCLLSLLTLCVGYLMMVWTREKTALHDVICGTRVARGER